MRAIFTCIFCLIALLSFSQDKNHSSSRFLLDSSRIKNQKIVTLIETDRFVVMTTYTLFIQNFKTWLKSYPDITEDKLLYNSIVKDTNGKNVKANVIAAKLNYIDRLNFRTAELLNKGNCLIFDKLKRKQSKKIEILKYSDIGVAGTKYSIATELILDVIEQTFEQTN